MELTRRDAVAALAAIGAGGAAAVGTRRLTGREDRAPGEATPSAPEADDRVRGTLVAAAEVVYPSELEGIEPFVEGFLEGRLAADDHAEGLRAAAAELDDSATAWYDGRFAELSVERREELLREVGADTAEEDPEGTTAERIRYYVVNELLLALYTSPTGGELVGIENPQGHPGGTDTYQRGPRT
jgi:hypothetical protein